MSTTDAKTPSNQKQAPNPAAKPQGGSCNTQQKPGMAQPGQAKKPGGGCC